MTDLQQQAPSAPPPGWYPDPVRPGSSRFWSGTGWTDQVNDPAVAVLEPVVELPPITFAAPPAPRESHATQEEWHQRPSLTSVRRVGAPPVSTTTRGASASGRPHDPYDRSWIAGVAIVLAVLSVPALAARVLWELPPLTQSMMAGAPIGISLLAFAAAARRRRGFVLPIVATVISAAVIVVGWVLDPAILRGIVDAIVALLPA